MQPFATCSRCAHREYCTVDDCVNEGYQHFFPMTDVKDWEGEQVLCL